MSELYGAPSGISKMITDEHTLATTRYNHAMSAKLEEESAQARRMQELMQQEGSSSQQIGSVEDPAARLMSLSNLAFQSGQVKFGAELATKASTIQRQRTQDTASLAAAEKAELDGNLKIANLTRELVKDVTDEASWTRANASFQMLTGQRSPFMGQPYSPELVKGISDSMVKASDKLLADYRQKEHERKKASDRETDQDRDANRSLRAQELQLRKAREARMAKNSGKKEKPPGFPSVREVDDARGLLKGMALDEDDLDDTATEIAQEARRIRQINPGLTPREAMAKILLEKQQRGDLVPGQKSKLPFFGTSGKAFSPLRPMQNPGSKDALVPGQYYTTPRGVAKWNGKAFTLANLPQISVTDPDSAEDDDD